MAQMRNNLSIKDKEKNLLHQSLLTGAVIMILAIVISLGIGAYSRDYPRASMGEKISGGMSYLSNPQHLFPLTVDVSMLLFGLIIIGLFLMVQYFNDKMRLHNNLYTIKGSTQWANISDIVSRYAEFVDSKKKDYIHAVNNAIFSAHVYISLNASKHFRALNTLLLGTTGSGKSRFILKPNVLQMNSSYVITDPKGELLDSCGEMLRRNGYHVRVFDILNMGNCDTYNPLKYCYKESDVKKIVQAFIKNADLSKGVSAGGGSKDPFWDDSMNAFLCAVVSFLTSKPEGSDIPYAQIPEITGGLCYAPVFANICELTRMANKKWSKNSGIEIMQGVTLGDGKNNTANASELSAIFENLRQYEANRQDVSPDEMIKPYCLREWENFKIAPEKTSTTILMTVAVKLDAFNIEQVRQLTSSDTINLDTFGTGRDAMFLIIPPTDRTYNFLVAFLYTQLFDILYKTGAEGSIGSKILKLRNGELVKYFPKEKVDAGIEKEIEAIKNAKLIFHEGEGKATIKKGDKQVEINDGYYDIVSSDNKLISRRPNLKQANKYLADLKKAKLVNGKNPKLPYHVRFLMDEFANIGELPEFKDKLATVRGYEISIMVICQSITQLKGMYEKDYEVIDANCPFTIFLGGDENTNNEYISKKMGKTTVKSNSRSIDSKNKGSLSTPFEERDLMKPEELGRMDYRKQLVLIYGEQPIMDDKVDYPALPNYFQTHDYADDIGHPEFNKFHRPKSASEKINLVFRPIEATAIPHTFAFTPEIFMKYMRSSTIDDAIDKADQNIERYSFSVASSEAMAF